MGQEELVELPLELRGKVTGRPPHPDLLGDFRHDLLDVRLRVLAGAIDPASLIARPFRYGCAMAAGATLSVPVEISAACTSMRMEPVIFPGFMTSNDPAFSCQSYRMPLRLWIPRAKVKLPSSMGMSTMPKCITLVPAGAWICTPMMEVSVRMTVFWSPSRISSENTTSSMAMEHVELDPDDQVIASTHVGHSVIARIDAVHGAKPDGPLARPGGHRSGETPAQPARR